MAPSPHRIEQAFLDDIVAHPDDPALWLILADWLAEQDDPRAELVRLTWQLQYEPDHADFAIRQARVQGLLAGGMVPVRPRRTFGGIECAWVPPGAFLMGSPETEAERGDDETQHRVRITSAFWLGVHPITQAQWHEVMGDNPSYFARTGEGKDAVAALSAADLERFPVEQVSWDMAVEFCTKLSERVGKRVTLPTEAQWEYACRAGTTTPFHFGSVLNGDQANCDGDYPYVTDEKGPYLERPTPVGLNEYPTNAWNLRDMHGNVREWCQDYYRADYEKLPPSDPLSEQGSGSRVLRGGSWHDHAWLCRAAYRIWNAPALGYSNVGLRVCCRLD